MLRLALTLLSPGGARARLSTLIYHRVLPRPDPLFPDLPEAAQFEAQMRWVRDWFNVLPLAEAVDRLHRKTLPERALAITFDDGYADNEELAAPILRRLGLTATFFVATDYVDGGLMWNDRVIEALRACRTDEIDLTSLGLGRLEIQTPVSRRQAIDRVLAQIKHLDYAEREAAVAKIVALAGDPPMPRLMMRPEQVVRLQSSGMTVGAHTMSHPILARLDAKSAWAEIGGSRERLEAMLRERVDLFAYPNGVPGRDYTAEHVEMARRCGFKAAVSTAWGVATRESDPYQLPRFTPWDRSRTRFGARLALNLTRRRHSTA